MSTLQVVRAWKDQSYRNSLSAEQLAELPAHPSGTIEFDRTAVAAKTNGSKCQVPVPTTMDCTYWCSWCSVGIVSGKTCA
jgi:mersacidin/lichenicidin family type 2 lantibiotic